MNAKNIIEGFKNLCQLEGFEIFTGWGLDFEDFEQGKANETGGLKRKSICISHDGFRPIGINEDSKHDKVVAMISIFLKTDENPELFVTELIDYINQNNNIVTTDVNVVEFVGATPIKSEKNSYVFALDYEIY